MTDFFFFQYYDFFYERPTANQCDFSPSTLGNSSEHVSLLRPICILFTPRKAFFFKIFTAELKTVNNQVFLLFKQAFISENRKASTYLITILSYLRVSFVAKIVAFFVM